MTMLPSQFTPVFIPQWGHALSSSNIQISIQNFNCRLPTDIPIERHAWVRIRDPNTDKRKLSTESSLLASIPLNQCCHLTINAAADAFATDDSMGIGGWVKLHSSTYWFSHTWSRADLQQCLPITRQLQRYITSWEALAQLCIILAAFQKCETRPGIIDIQPGSDNTGAEANINHGFSTTEILADIIKLVSTKQIQCNTILNIHHIPGEKNFDAGNLSRGKLFSFLDELRVNFDLNDIFNQTPFPRYINNLVQWDPDKFHPLAKRCVFFVFSSVVRVLCY